MSAIIQAMGTAAMRDQARIFCQPEKAAENAMVTASTVNTSLLFMAVSLRSRDKFDNKNVGPEVLTFSNF